MVYGKALPAAVLLGPAAAADPPGLAGSRPRVHGNKAKAGLPRSEPLYPTTCTNCDHHPVGLIDKLHIRRHVHVIPLSHTPGLGRIHQPTNEGLFCFSAPFRHIWTGIFPVSSRYLNEDFGPSFRYICRVGG